MQAPKRQSLAHIDPEGGGSNQEMSGRGERNQTVGRSRDSHEIGGVGGFFITSAKRVTTQEKLGRKAHKDHVKSKEPTWWG